MNRLITLFWAFLFAISLIYFLLIVSPARADIQDPVLILVKTLAGEAGFKRRPDHPSMLHVLDWRRKHRPANAGFRLSETALAYSTLHRAQLRNPSSAHWRQVHALTLETAPEWMVELVTAFRENPASVPDPCRGQAREWAAPLVVIQRGFLLRVLDCGDTRNAFLR